jgi:tetratricopeptide (TPR) repeat protein
LKNWNTFGSSNKKTGFDMMVLRSMVFLFTFFLTVSINAQDYSSYMMVMVKQKKAFKMARSEPEFQTLASDFERIANAESDQWHPLYYAAMCNINASFISKNKNQKNIYLSKAAELIDKALIIYPDESELYVLQALMIQGRTQMETTEKALAYLREASELLEVAEDYNSENPRIYYLRGLNTLFSPETMGGGPENACPQFEKAREKFKNNIPQNVLSPTWGGEENDRLYRKHCGGMD